MTQNLIRPYLGDQRLVLNGEVLVRWHSAGKRHQCRCKVVGLTEIIVTVELLEPASGARQYGVGERVNLQRPPATGSWSKYATTLKMPNVGFVHKDHL